VKRATEGLSRNLPVALTPGFQTPDRTRQWSAFLSRNGIVGPSVFAEVTSRLAEFLVPILADEPQSATWRPRDGLWRVTD